MTVLQELVRSLGSAAEHNRNDVVAPRCILWPDGDRQWESAIRIIAANTPHLFTLGDYAADQRQGPAAYLRAQLDGAAPANEIPIFYLPGVGRTAFRSASDCPEHVHHLYALQFEGQFWLQRNGKDWTPFAFLSSNDGGLGLDVARDAETLTAIRQCLAKLLEADAGSLRKGKLEAADFRELVATDPERMLLRWIGQPQLHRLQWYGAEWTNYRAICRDRFAFDPESDGELVAAEKLAAGTGEWEPVWRRYCDSPAAFPGVMDVLSRLTPPDLFSLAEGYPAINERRENDLRAALTSLAALTHEAARKRAIELATTEEPRSNWVWAKLGQAPLAKAVGYLRVLVEAQSGFAGAKDWPSLADGYASAGWEVDVAALHALAVARRPDDLHAVGAALRGVYLPWLESLAHAVQGHASSYPNGSSTAGRELTPFAGTVFVFVDGLRFDLGRLLAHGLSAPEVKIETSHEWAALPTVTATAKPAWRPLAGRLAGASGSAEFQPQEAGTGKPLSTARFRVILAELGIDYLAADQLGDPSHCAWTEIGAFDRHGHDEGVRLAWRIEEQLADVKHRVRSLFAAGWNRVTILTDHGWLLMPGALPKVDLPKHLSLSRWGRCATPHPGAKHGFKELPWFWDNSLPVVLAPGIGCFEKGLEYTHGGLTLQEALLPRIEVTCVAKAMLAKPELVNARWKGLRLSLNLKGAAGLGLDLRAKAADPASSVLPEGARNKTVSDGGETSILVERDELIGTATLLVLTTPDGTVVFKHPLNIGEN